MASEHLIADAVAGGFVAGMALKFFVVFLQRIARDTRPHRRGV